MDTEQPSGDAILGTQLIIFFWSNKIMNTVMGGCSHNYNITCMRDAPCCFIVDFSFNIYGFFDGEKLEKIFKK